METDTQQFDDVLTGTIYDTACPVVRIYPETGERLLVLGHSVQNFVGLEKYASQKLFNRLRSYLTAAENTVSWSWKSAGVVIWDNPATERYAAGESSGRHRVERRIATNGDLPVAGPPQAWCALGQSRRRPGPPSFGSSSLIVRSWVTPDPFWCRLRHESAPGDPRVLD
ncbi:TauD/TfdA dioxygenase family protein [Bradyrhizobium sp. CCBAU 51627]|uniref:TauD/TfdA dioxygenase family protein n=1 Tax=Bradyrhizobium sp. CCBAU 51627 TaxID=1325088 RepID=UPI003FA466B4